MRGGNSEGGRKLENKIKYLGKSLKQKVFWKKEIKLKLNPMEHGNEQQHAEFLQPARVFPFLFENVFFCSKLIFDGHVFRKKICSKIFLFEIKLSSKFFFARN